ncbi:twin-arginine translocase subunit TatC [Hymenobacter defluvii]|uniref:Sec-independent protein translocase protein TatC n=3 Tax=Hymenobacteraceae TaxID=1853232 RepID=A0ABS6X382_9BACT|nr:MULTISPECIES: twin-arginine translocase subunit TatC [Hymenobacter]MBO3271285.1 twin-arginine translocase subunit TatC [Hymenobacter defluvii]MBW3130276.1 twin-arginine translocase subunit TatC [Hymenobacter profundi]MBW3130295.1 twin-arginine translocase subunit TatC [Hymenobacter profundi]
MSFIDHLEALRWHIIRAAIAVVVFSLAAFFSKEFLFHDLILGPSRPDFWTYRKFCELGQAIGTPDLCIDKIGFVIQNREMSGQLSMHISTSFIVGLVLGFPYLFWELWRFIKPGLYPQEQENSRGAVFFVSILFLTGLLFGYYIAAPLSINFLAAYNVDPTIENQIDLQSYLSTLTTMSLSCALVFELPMIVFFLAKAGLITSEIMTVYRKHAIVIILIVAAIITPPEITSQIIVTIPIVLLYELSIHIARRVRRDATKKLNAELAANQGISE